MTTAEPIVTEEAHPDASTAPAPAGATPVTDGVHAGPLDHSWDKYASTLEPPEHPDDLCNGVHCTVGPTVLPDGRAVWHAGVHRTYTRTQTTEFGDVLRIALGVSHETDGPDVEHSFVELYLHANDLEGGTGSDYEARLTADEADALAQALTSRAAGLRRAAEARRAEAIGNYIVENFPNQMAAVNAEANRRGVSVARLIGEQVAAQGSFDVKVNVTTAESPAADGAASLAGVDSGLVREAAFELHKALGGDVALEAPPALIERLQVVAAEFALHSEYVFVGTPSPAGQDATDDRDLTAEVRPCA